jgi:hypothetical protein
MITITSTIIPIPPIQWVKLLQNKIDFGRASISVKIDAPVVVKPDIDSKKASINPGMALEIIYGEAPINEKKTHEKETMKPASFFVNDSISSAGCLDPLNKNPTISATKPDTTNGVAGSEKTRATKTFENMAIARMNKLLPTIGRFNLRFKTLPILCSDLTEQSWR